MPTTTFQVGFREVEPRHRAERLRAYFSKLVEQARERPPFRCLEMCEALEVIEGARAVMLQDCSHARQPVRAVRMNQVGDNIEGTPRVLAFVGGGPLVGQATQLRIDGRWRSCKDGGRIFDRERTASAI